MTKKRPRNLSVRMKFIDGRWEVETGGQVPVEEGTEAELRVPIHRITNQDFIERMTKKEIIPILPMGTVLRALLSPKDRVGISPENQHHLISYLDVVDEMFSLSSDYHFPSDACFVEVNLGPPTGRQAQSTDLYQGGLWLICEGAEPTELRSSTIVLPKGITDQKAISLNHAFTMLSEVYEPWRKAHTGSAYERFFYQEADGKWYPLLLLRDASIAAQEQKIAADLWKKFLRHMKARK